MRVRELIAALSRLDPELPVVIEQMDLELVGEYAEVMDLQWSDDLFFDPKQFALDGRGYDRPDWHNSGTAARNHPTEPVALISSQPPCQPVIDAEVIPAALESE